MPEEKKESFTFSDKIKSSKPAGSKSFAKSSSKIGRDGKPRQTLFERTRRDAPFFIAALVALLLLPFLYKYSGQSSEDTLLTPGSEESQFDPERYGFDTAMVEDADGQIAQLSGRSSFDLIKGWGNQEEDYGDRDDLDFDASASASASGEYEAEGRYDAEHHSRTDIDEEENITNIYKRRARAGTRAAFRRTQVGKLDPANMKRAGGGRLNINPWGGSLKEAANKVKDSGPRNAPKPVSLQPLRAGGPARSNFGQGAAGAARRGLDNMGKADAKQALHDAYVKPVGPSRSGGIDLFADGRTGGNGKLDHNINIGKGQTPWWWDMMKTRMQREWEERFKYKWGWINWATDIAKNILKGLINCLITGDSGGDPDNFLGISAGGGTDPTCCGVSEAKAASKKEIEEAGGFEAWCKIKSNQGKLKALGYNCSPAFKGGAKTEVALGPMASRLKCLGLGVGAYASGSLGLNAANGNENICDEMPYLYRVIPSGQARKWHIYTYVIARNYFPDSLKGRFPVNTFPKGGNLLCVKADEKHGGTGLNHTGGTSAGTGYGAAADGKKNAKGTKVTDQKSTATETNHSERVEIRRNTLEIDPNLKNHSCVIYVQNSGTFDYEVFKNEIIDQFKKMLGGKPEHEELAQKAFHELDLMFVGSVAMKDNLAAGRGSSVHKLYDGMLPMLYWEFEDAYIMHKGVTNRQNGRDNDISKKKWRVEGQDLFIGQECSFENWHMDCVAPNQPMAELRTHATKYENGKWSIDTSKRPNPREFFVSAEFQNLNGSQDETPFKQTGIQPQVSEDGFTFTYALNMQALTEQAGQGGDLVGNIVWSVQHGADGRVSKQTCPFGVLGTIPQEEIEIRTECTPGQVRTGFYPGMAECPAKQECTESGSWGAWQMTDPNNPKCGGKLVVGFYEEVQTLPCDEKVYSGQRRLETSNNHDEKVIIDACDEWKMCDLPVDQELLIAPDDITIGYVQQAIAEFNRKNQGQNANFISYSSEELKSKLTVTNLIDAIRMHPDEDVPANVVCVLGKTIGANASDPQAPEYDNVFGAFLAFMGLDAASFPSKYTYDCKDGVTVIGNKRFPCGGLYWWGGYVDSNQPNLKGFGKRSTVFESKDGKQIWRTFPLSGLLRAPKKDRNEPSRPGKLPVHDGNEGLLERPADMKPEQVNAEEYYRDVFAETYWDLLHGEECKYTNGETLKKVQVLEYLELLCENGVEIKPKAWLECSQNTRKQKAVRRAQPRKRSGVRSSKKSSLNRKAKTAKNKTRIKKKFGAYNKKCAGC